jgi:uncharacterized protein with von Willebrand factor type A (vWA) domain
MAFWSRRPVPARAAQPHHWRYSVWDGSQTGFDLDAETILDEIADDLLYHGDLNAALRRLMQQGFQDRNQERVMGMQDLMERLRQRRQDELGRYDLGGVYADIAERLDEVVDMERDGIERRQDQARQETAETGESRRQDIVDQLAEQRRQELDELPPDLAGKVRALQDYDFMDDDARAAFEELLDELRQELLRSTFNQMQDALQNMSPEQMQRMKDMLAELNQMLEQRAAGEEPDFDGFMDRYGDMFPGNPQSLDELLEQMARSMAQMSQLMASMSPEQRRQLQELSNSLLDDIDLRWQMDQLASNLQQAFPEMGWGRRMPFSGDEPLDLGQAAGLLDTLGDLDSLEHMLRQATQPAALAEVDLDRARELLGDDAGHSLERLAELAKMLEEAGLIEQKEGRYELTPQAMRKIGQRALSDLFEKLARDRIGNHDLDRTGVGHERSYEHKPYEFGDPFNLNVEQTLRNAMRRQGPGTPIRLSPDDFEIEQTELLTRTATVLLLDLSMSMPMRGNFLPAKKVAMALHSLISSRFPRDYLGIVGFSNIAHELRAEQIPEVSWDYVYGTNMHHALMLARRMLNRQTGTKQVIMITDGEPTAHLEDGEPLFQYPPHPRTIEETLREVMRCTRDDIRINTFMLDADWGLRSFVERMTSINRGRAFFTTPDTLGSYVLVDFIEHRTQKKRTA